MKEHILQLIRKDTILVVSGILALLSCLITPPSAAYADYIDVRVLSLLFCLMAVVCGMQSAGFFQTMSMALVNRVRTMRGLALILTMLCFLLSMFITNDVTLITLVPFTLLVFRRNGSFLIMTLVLETVAANLGSMLTPFGNPQNLFLYTEYNYSIFSFIRVMLPYTALSLVLIVALLLWRFPRSTPLMLESGETHELANTQSLPAINRRAFTMHLILFAIALLAVARLLDYKAVLAITVIVIAIADRSILKQVNYSLLLTFIFFFVFTGNIGANAAIVDFLNNVVYGHETLTAVLASQAISNVPAAFLLSGFTHSSSALIIGTNLGGLGTLIASMASLITYQYYSREYPESRGVYLLAFTLVNIVFLVILYGLRIIL